MRTSLTHPLLIAEVTTGQHRGKIGLTLCPGKEQKNAFTGDWQRNLGQDLDVIMQWSASAVVTLLSDRELLSLNVPHIGQEIVSRHIHWCQLPIDDGCAPDRDFEALWQRTGEGLRARLSRSHRRRSPLTDVSSPHRNVRWLCKEMQRSPMPACRVAGSTRG